MAQLSVQNITIDGITANYYSADAAGDQFPNNGKTFLHVKNGSGSPITVTIKSQVATPPAGTAAQDKQITVAANNEKLIGPFAQNGYNDETGQVHVSYSAVTSVTIAVLNLKN